MSHKRTKEEYEEAIKNAQSIAEALRNLGIKDRGGNYRIIKKAIKEYNIDTSHFLGMGWNVGMKFKPKEAIKTDELLVANSNYNSYKLKNRLFNEGYKERRCECCRLTEWMGEPIPLELHHINGDNTDNRIENLQILCPNCHAFTENYRGRAKSAHQETDDVEPI